MHVILASPRAARLEEALLTTRRAIAGATLALLLACGALPCRAQGVRNPGPAGTETREFGAPPADSGEGFSGLSESLALQPLGLFSRRGQALFTFDARSARLIDHALAEEPGGPWGAEAARKGLYVGPPTSLLAGHEARRRDILYTGRRLGWLASLPDESLAAGIEMPRVEKDENSLQQAIARGVLGFLVGRAISELSGHKPQRTAVSVRSATDPHGHGVGLGVSASW